jgi:type VI secretion system protein ImpF
MREPRAIKGAKAPLFDRLAGGPAAQREAGSPKVLDSAELCESLRVSLLQLLNTRFTAPPGRGEGVEGTVFAYGVPDFASLAPASEADRKLLEATLQRRITAHEPRLRDVQVLLIPTPGVPTALTGSVTALLRVGSVHEQVSFALAVDREGVRADMVEISG